MPRTTKDLDLLLKQQIKKKYSQINSRSKAIKGILIGFLIGLGLWCQIIMCGIVISWLSK
jgi:hypothetical protein